MWVDADRARALEDVAKKFEQEKGVKVNLVVKDYGKIRDEFTAQVPTGKGPDITIGGHDWIGAFVKDGIVAPVELGDKAADFEKVAIEAVTYDGKTYGLPYAIENIAVLRNTALADSTPATYDDMIAKGRAAGTEYPFVVGLDPQASDPYHLYPFQTSFGTSVFGRNADGSYDAEQADDRRRGRAEVRRVAHRAGRHRHQGAEPQPLRRPGQGSLQRRQVAVLPSPARGTSPTPRRPASTSRSTRFRRRAAVTHSPSPACRRSS